MVEDKAGQRITFNPSQCAKLSVYESSKNELASGDKVRITRNDANLDVVNGDRFSVKYMDQKEIVLTNNHREIRLSTDKPLHLDYAYATTVHSSQGLSAGITFFDVVANSRTTAKDVFYVAISRAKHLVKIYTDKRENLVKMIGRDNIKHAALDLVRLPSIEKQRNKLPMAELNRAYR